MGAYHNNNLDNVIYDPFKISLPYNSDQNNSLQQDVIQHLINDFEHSAIFELTKKLPGIIKEFQNFKKSKID